ncbi:MAG TPA: GDP-mannose 4,6-dehydratase [Candidatus Paceibacterota bacterium]|nr:GDP-mannose 4,6-dehydratase [Candidatus Paceibacterota bacterium]
MQRILVTGGLGFIGSHFVQLLLDKGYYVINVDKKTYAIREDLEFEKHPNYELVVSDICDLKALPRHITHVVNFAAESHVDNSIKNSSPFFRSNVEGVYTLLELVRKIEPAQRPVFIQISTDEVYGDIAEGSFTESDRLKPSNPYSATKAAADQLVFAWARTYNLRARLCRPSNNYGFGQRAEKLIPNTMKRAQKGQKAAVYGTGLYKREWTFVNDNCEAILLVMENGLDGEIYNISSCEERTNLDVVQRILEIMGRPSDFFEYVGDRPGQDIRYSVDTTKIQALGWKPTMTLEQYLPICKAQNEERTRKMGVGKKRSIARKLGLEKIFYGS